MKAQPMILVVDDEAAIRDLVKSILQSSGYLVDTTANGKEAMAAFETRRYHLVLTDMMMPEMGGMELVQYLRLHFPDTLVVVFTGFASYHDAVAAVKLGAFDYLTKPLQPEILRLTIARALEYQELCRSQRDLETVFQGAEALGWQVLELVSTTQEAAVLNALKEKVGQELDLKVVGQAFLGAAREIMGVTNSSIFLYDPIRGQFSGLAAQGPEAEAKMGAMITAAGVMGYVATHRRPLLVPDLSRDSHFLDLRRSETYQTNSFMVIPLTGYKFWGVINLADRQDGKPFSSRDLFLGWLLGRLLVELLESRESLADKAPTPSLSPWISEQIPVGMAFLDDNLAMLQGNPALERLADLPHGGLAGQKIFPYLGLSNLDQETLQEAFREVIATQEPREFQSLKTSHRSKTPRYLGIKMFPLPAEQGLRRCLLLVEDITEVEQLRQRLQLYEHLAIMGKLTLCVAHELNNPLDGIRRYMSLAIMKKDQPSEVERYLTEAQKGIKKMAQSVQSLMYSSNPAKAPPRASDNLRNLLQDAIKIMIFQASDQRVKVDFHAPAEFQTMLTEADLYYVFINVIKNALQAIPQGGHLRIDGRLNENEVEISFQDTGPGLSVQELDQVFRPFYTTKGESEGLGLGLPICQKILERYQGRLVIQSQPGQGTKVRVLLPRFAPGGAHAH